MTEPDLHVSVSEEQQRRLKRFGMLVLLGLIAAAMLVATFLVTRQDSADEPDSPDQAERELAAGADAEAAARELLEDLTSYDFRSVEEDRTWLDAIGDDALRRRMARDAAQLEDPVRTGRLSAAGEVLEIGHRIVDEEEVVVLALVEQVVRRPGTKGAERELQAFSLTLVREDDAWLVVSLDRHRGGLAG